MGFRLGKWHVCSTCRILFKIFKAACKDTRSFFSQQRAYVSVLWKKSSTILEMYNQYLLPRTYIAIFCAKVSQIEELRLVNLNEEDLTRWIKCIFRV